jgi:DNA-binding MarR family transcriptional regulator
MRRPDNPVMAFDPLVANPGRLEILAALAAEGRRAPVEFVRLRERTRLTDGNLACHAKRLHAAGLVGVNKRFREGKPVTSFVLTAAGRAALEAHVERLLLAVRPPATEDPTSDQPANPNFPAEEPVEEVWVD